MMCPLSSLLAPILAAPGIGDSANLLLVLNQVAGVVANPELRAQ